MPLTNCKLSKTATEADRMFRARSDGSFCSRLDRHPGEYGRLVLPQASAPHHGLPCLRGARNLRWRHRTGRSYFGGVRKGKRGRGAAGKVVVFGMLKRGGKVYTKVVGGTRSVTLMPVIQRKIAPDSIVYTDSYRSYNALDVSGFHHASTTRSILPVARTISTASQTSGTKPSACCASTTEFPKTHSPCL